MAKQWKKMQGTTPLTLAPYPEGGSIGKKEREKETDRQTEGQTDRIRERHDPLDLSPVS